MGGYTCCVPGCYNNSTHSTDKTLKYHRFPENRVARRKWVQMINRQSDDGKLFQPDSGSHRVCSSHFVGGIKTTVNNIPTIFPTRRLLTAARPRTTSSAARAAEPLPPPPKSPSPVLSPADKQHLRLVELGLNTPMVGAEVVIETQTPILPRTTLVKDASGEHSYCSPATQMQTPSNGKLQKKIRHAARDLFTSSQSISAAKAEVTKLKSMVLDCDFVMKCPDTLNLYTGFKIKQHFMNLIDTLSPDFKILQFPGGKKPKLSHPDCLLMTLVKYKLDTPQEDLAFRFGTDQSDVSRIVATYTDLMYQRFRQTPIWPSQKLVREYMPDSFQEKYGNTRVIIDCTEIFIEKPSSTLVQQVTYSTYKSNNTAKALIGITPHCFISFLPDIQPGRMSDREVVVRSGLLDLLEPGDLVMADRGFTIEDLLTEHTQLNIPPFLRDKPQFDRAEVADTRSIAAVRIHVERVIGRVRRYRILNNTYPNNSLYQLNKIWVNCCYLTNLQHPQF